MIVIKNLTIENRVPSGVGKLLQINNSRNVILDGIVFDNNSANIGNAIHATVGSSVLLVNGTTTKGAEGNWLHEKYAADIMSTIINKEE